MNTADLERPNISFVHVYPDALPVMRADKTALGTMPTDAYLYCEAMRTATGFGWYAFPARGVKLLFDGADIFIAEGNDWEKLYSRNLPNIDTWWNRHCPENLIDMPPPFITALSAPGYLQIWSGSLVDTSKDWSILVRPLANIVTTNQLFCFEGVVETDHFSPSPLFINLRLLHTDTVIEIRADEPLFQVQPIHRVCYQPEVLENFKHRSIRKDMSVSDWERYRGTIRMSDPTTDTHSIGKYAVKTRKRTKSQNGWKAED